ncbi:MAG: glycoside hydrolase family 127 protein [Clostridia bacterium]|nr:glycoside hydrolase family 127 protein [Clostridia bacterium]
MKLNLNAQELRERIYLNYHRLADNAYYQIGEVFPPLTYDWPGDKEGRALLAFVSHYKISGDEIPCMEQMLELMPDKLNAKGYLGRDFGDIVSEQQLSGHSWLLRGLCEHYEQFGDDYCLQTLKTVTENLYLPTKGLYRQYPLDREQADVGGVSGTELGTVGRWLLSTDVGCGFMSVDGLSHVYRITKDERVAELLEEMIDVYLAIDKVAIRAQTHCTLTIARGIMRMYRETGKQKYLDGAKSIYELYVNGGGMTETYHNLNWWGRPNTWSEPCAIIDSLMLAVQLYEETGEEQYRKLAARVWHNAFATLQRDNGGAGTDTLVCEGSPWDDLMAKSYEAPFCCSMRLAEGLWFISEHTELLYAETEGCVTKNERGIYTDGDLIYTEVSGGGEVYADGFVWVDGHRLCPILKYYRIPKDVMNATVQKIRF